MHRRGQPEPRAQRRQFVGDGLGRGDALGERHFEHGGRAGHVALDGLLDAVHGLGEQLPREVVDRVAAGGVRQHADDDGGAQHQRHVGQREQGAQGESGQQFHCDRCSGSRSWRRRARPLAGRGRGAIVPDNRDTALREPFAGENGAAVPRLASPQV